MSVPAERRYKKRYEIRLRGQIGPAGGRQSECLLRDYCSGGMLVQQMDADAIRGPAALKAGQTAQLNTELLTPKGPHPVRIRATVAWVKDDHLGLSFSKSSDKFVAALKRHDRLARGDTPARPRLHGSAEVRGLARMRRAAQDELPGLLRLIVVSAGEKLLEQADAVNSNIEQQQIFEDVNALEALRRDDSLPRAVLAHAFDARDGAEEEPEAGELRLVEPDEFERWLEASRVATNLQLRFNQQLGAIGARLAALHDGGLPGALSVPFEPRHFTAALKDIAKDHGLGATARSVLFDCAAVGLKETLGDFYSVLDEALDAAGAPQAQVGRPVRSSHPARRRQPAHTDNERPGSPRKTAEELAPATEAAAVNGQVTVDPNLLTALLAREAQQREQHAGELMAYIGNVPNMSESLATWVQQLGEPLAREAAANPAFFYDKQNPLREIVDGLGHLQMFSPSLDQDPENDPIHQRIAELLESISSGGADQAARRAIADEVGRLTSEQSRLYQRNVERVAEASEGRDRVRLARQAVLHEINQRYAGRQVPGVVPELLDVGWRAVLELAYLNSIGGGDRYDEHLGLLDSLVARLGGEAFAKDVDEVDGQQLCERIEAELDVAAFDPFRRNTVESRLREELGDPLRLPVQLVEMPRLQGESDVCPSTDAPPGVSENSWKRLRERCLEIVVGDRVRLLDDAAAQDSRVAWIRDDHELFVLVDHRGLRVRDMALGELALGLHRRRIELERGDGRPLTDRAVDSILQRMEERLSLQAAQDSLTGLINRQQFHAALEKALAVPDRPADAGVLLWIDVDQFRLINDIHDYETGDRLLVDLARLLERVAGAKVVGHMGGDRFAVLLPDLDWAGGERRALGICQAVREMPFEWEGQALTLSVSIGVVGMQTAQNGLSSLLQAADNAMGAAKAAGGNRVYVYREDDPDIVRRKESVQWVAQVDEALNHGQLHLRCQPIVPVRSDAGLVPHYEILLGVSSGAAKPLPIAEFIDAAERYNRMRAVDRWVTKTTMEWIAAHHADMPALHGFAVNLSGQTASDSGFVDFVREHFQRTGIDPSWLSFEVTETAAVADLSSSAGIIRELKALGCKVALDDFGSGLASYSYLKELPVDWLKIDGVFVRKIATDRDDYAVVKSINEIGHFLGKKTIAEYVADDEILRLVHEIGIDYAQGFGISAPTLLDDLIDLPEADQLAAAPSRGGQ